MLAPLHSALVAAVAGDLRGGRERAEVLSSADFGRLHSVIDADRLAGWIATAIAAGVVEADADVVDQAMTHWRSQLRGCVIIESKAVGVARLLAAEGVPWRLLKGPAVAHLDYPNPALRTFGDIDVLVHPDHWDRTVTMLTEVGWHRKAGEVAPGFDARFGKGVTLSPMRRATKSTFIGASRSAGSACVCPPRTSS